MLNLVRNENMKIYRRARTWVFLGIIIFALILQAAFTLKSTQNQEEVDWKQQLVQQNQEMRQQLDNPDTPIPLEARRQLETQINLNQYAIDHNLPPNDYNAWKFLKESTGMMELLTIFVVVVAGDAVASEFTWGTIKLLLIRPASRTKILISKYLAVLLYALFLLAALFVASFLIGGMTFGFDGYDQPYVSLTEAGIQESTVGLHALRTFALSPVSLFMIATVAFMISAAFRSTSLAIALSLLVMFLGQMLVMMLSAYDWVKYILFANLDLNIYFEGGPPIEGMTLGFSVAMLLIYFVVLHLIGWLLFTKRDVAA